MSPASLPGVTAGSPLRKDTLSFNPGLVRRHRPILTYRVLAGVTAIPGRSILDKECSSASRGEFKTEAFEILIPPYDVTIGRAGEGIDRTLRKLANRWLPRCQIGSQKNATWDTVGNQNPQKSLKTQ